jgi:4,5:9,10-diseco-3-hydroxy-5,9,17-trioxoandrosta-1(10),2-diene-4-oate hydrolase
MASDAAIRLQGGAELLRAHVGADEACARRSVDGVELAYDDEGDGPAVVCLHALAHGARDFARLRARLGARHRVVALDWPGHGRSAADRVPTSATRYADLLGRFLDALGVDEAVLVGNSIGGAAAVRWAATHPDRVRGLVLENPGGLDATDDRLARIVFAAMDRFFAAGCRRAWWFPRAFATYYRTCVLGGRAAGEQRARIVATAYDVAPLLRDAWRSFATPAEDVRALVPRIACPVLAVWATGDRFVQLRRNLPALRQLRDARVERVRALHAAHLEQPERFEALVEGFLAGLEERARAAGQTRARG